MSRVDPRHRVIRHPAIIAAIAGLCHAGALLPLTDGAASADVVNGGPVGAVTAGLLVAAGLVLAAIAVHRAAEPESALRAGFVMGATFSLVALHWIPAATESWWGVGGGLLAGITVWSVHGAWSGVVFYAMARLRGAWPFPVIFAAGWIVLEWIPGAVPVLRLPRPALASALVDLPGALSPAPVLGAAVVIGLWAGLTGGVVAAVASDGGGAGSGGTRSHARWGWPLAFLIPLVAFLPVLGSGIERWGLPGADGSGKFGSAAVTATGMGAHGAIAEFSVVLAQLPLGRDALSDRGVRRSEVLAGVSRGPADLWPEALLAEPGELPHGIEPAGTRPLVAGVHTEADGRRYNSLVMVHPDGSSRVVHRKRRLVPGVERAAFGSAGSGEGGVSPGPPPRAFEWGGRRVGALICFETLFPAAVASLRRDGATLLLHAGNDAMLQPGGTFPVFGDAAGRQQEAILRLRALEFAIPIARSSMGGRSGAWGADGRPLGPPAGGERIRVVIPATGAPPPAARLAPWTGPAAAAALLLGMLGATIRPPGSGSAALPETRSIV